MAVTTIFCTTCASAVPWAPHCAECGAYLEFAGEPPWRPAPSGPLADSDGPGQVIVDDSETIAVVDAVHVESDQPPGASTIERQQDSHAGTARMIVAGLILVPVLWWAAGHVIGAMAAVVFLAWAAVLWPRRRSTAQTVAAPEHPTEVIEIADAIVTAHAVEEAVEVLARAPQVLPRRAVEATRALVVTSPEGDIRCVSCLRFNTDDRHYCAWCGAVLVNAAVSPATVVYEPAASLGAGSQGKGSRSRRSLSGSWRTPIVVLTLVGVLVGSIVFALFGPGAFRVRFGMTTVYQIINQFIDPYSGDQVDIAEVTATSTTGGTSAREIVGPDATTFWVSAPSAAQGAGSEITFTFDGLYTINRMVIMPGIQNGVFDTRGVATPRDITLTFDDGTSTTAQLDLLQAQGDLQQLVRFAKVTTQTVRLTIDSVYPPRTPSDQMVSEVAISGVRFLAPPAPPQFINLPTDIQPRTSLPGTTS